MMKWLKNTPKSNMIYSGSKIWHVIMQIFFLMLLKLCYLKEHKFASFHQILHSYGYYKHKVKSSQEANWIFSFYCYDGHNSKKKAGSDIMDINDRSGSNLKPNRHRPECQILISTKIEKISKKHN